MESNIKKLSMKEILSRIGVPITINEIRNAYKFDIDLNLVMNFEDDLKQIEKLSEIEQIICEYEDIFDKEIYVFHIARLLEKDIEEMKRAKLLGINKVEQHMFTNDVTGKNKRRCLVNAKNLLKNSDVIDIVVKKNSNGEFEIYSSIDFLQENTEFSNNMKLETEKRVEEIEQKIGLDKILNYLEKSDLKTICKYSNLPMLLMLENEKLEVKIKRYLQYIDLNKMIAIANRNYFEQNQENLYDFSTEELEVINEFLKTELPEDIKKEVELDVEESQIDEETMIEENTIEDVKIEETASVETENQEENNSNEEIVSVETENQEENNSNNEEIISVENEIIVDSQKEVIERDEIKLDDVIEDEPQDDNAKIEESTEKENTEESNMTNKYINNFASDKTKIIMDFENRKNTIFKLDENYMQEDLEDGTTIFSLPNKGCYIIEVSKNNQAIGGNATYIINKNLYEERKDFFIENKKLKQRELSILKLENNKNITKLVYTGWENTINTFFNMETEEKYSEEEILNIDKIIEKIKK